MRYQTNLTRFEFRGAYCFRFPLRMRSAHLSFSEGYTNISHYWAGRRVGLKSVGSCGFLLTNMQTVASLLSLLRKNATRPYTSQCRFLPTADFVALEVGESNKPPICPQIQHRNTCSYKLRCLYALTTLQPSYTMISCSCTKNAIVWLLTRA